MKSIYTINAAITKITECLIVKMHAPAFNLQMGVSLVHGASLCFVLLPALQTLEATFQVKNNLRSTPASTALAQVLHRSHSSLTANHHLHGSGERN